MIWIQRRELIMLLGSAAAAWPLGARAQQTRRVYRVALVFTTSPVSEMVGADPIHPLARSFVQSLRTLGYLQGQNLVLEHRSAEGRFERFPEIMRELVAIKTDVIVTVANPMTRAAKDVTGTDPIVMAYSVSPVELGVVQSLSRPGGNVTGLTMNVGSELPGCPRRCSRVDWRRLRRRRIRGGEATVGYVRRRSAAEPLQ